MDNSIIFPAPLSYGDKIAICSPAGPVKAENVEGACAVLEAEGWRTEVMPHTLGKTASTAAATPSDLTTCAKPCLTPR